MGTGSYLPEKVLTNYDLEKIVDTTDEWIRTRTGIRERRTAAPHESTSDLAEPACRQALEAAGLTPQDIDLLMVATITPDTYCPSAACWLQNKLDARRAWAFDINAACSGFIYGLSVAEQYIKTGAARNILFASAEVMTRTLNWQDRASCVLWGDGAGVVVISAANDGRGLLSTHLHSDGRLGEMLQLPGGGSRTTPINTESVAKDLHSLRMMGPDSFKVAVRSFSSVCEEALNHNGLTVDDIVLLIPHQANIRILEAVARRLGLPMEKVFITIHKYGNMSSATIPVALDEAVREKRIKRGDKILLAAFGGGLTWGSAVINW